MSFPTSFKLRILRERVFPDEGVIEAYRNDTEAYIITNERLLLFGSDGWIFEFQIADIDIELFTHKGVDYILIVDVDDPNSESYLYPGLYPHRETLLRSYRTAQLTKSKDYSQISA